MEQISDRRWAQIEAEFRVWSFRVLYRRTFKHEHDPWLRFLKAHKASLRPILDRKAVIDWYEKGVPHDDDDEEPRGPG